MYFTYGISDEWTVGIGLYSPYGLKVEWPEAWHPIGRTIITSADLKTYDISPTVAYKHGPLRIGVGIQIMRATVQLQQDIGPILTPGAYAHANLGAGTWGWGGNVGIQYEIIEKTLQVGAFYRSQVKLSFDGNAALHQRAAAVREHPGEPAGEHQHRPPELCGLRRRVAPDARAGSSTPTSPTSAGSSSRRSTSSFRTRRSTSTGRSSGTTPGTTVWGPNTRSASTCSCAPVCSSTRRRARPSPCSPTSPTRTA